MYWFIEPYNRVGGLEPLSQSFKLSVGRGVGREGGGRAEDEQGSTGDDVHKLSFLHSPPHCALSFSSLTSPRGESKCSVNSPVRPLKIATNLKVHCSNYKDLKINTPVVNFNY